MAPGRGCRHGHRWRQSRPQGRGTCQDTCALPGVLQGKARLSPHRGHTLLSGLLLPIRSEGREQQGHRLQGGSRNTPGCPQKSRSQLLPPALPPRTFPVQLGQLPPPGAEQALRGAVPHHCHAPAQRRCPSGPGTILSPHPHQLRAPPSPLPRCKPYCYFSCTKSWSGKTRGMQEGKDVFTSQPQRDDCT